jgi:hypothetical protein
MLETINEQLKTNFLAIQNPKSITSLKKKAVQNDEISPLQPLKIIRNLFQKSLLFS